MANSGRAAENRIPSKVEKDCWEVICSAVKTLQGYE